MLRTKQAFRKFLLNEPTKELLTVIPELSPRASQVALVIKTPPARAGDVRDVGSIPGSGRSPGGEHGNPLQYSCLEKAMDRGAWRATVHSVAKSSMQLSMLAQSVPSPEGCADQRN